MREIAESESAVCRPERVSRDGAVHNPGQGYFLCKRVLDLFVSAVLLVVLAPVWVIIALLIKLDCQGPVLFTQFAIGQHGADFRLLKFRTMRPGSQGADHRADVLRNMRENTPTAYDTAGRPIYKTALVDTSRITRVGRVLRRTSLDELPQLWCVFTGEMSLVGPRPSLPWETALYTPEQRCRLEAKPGMTGLYQVTARNRVPISEMVRIDLDYVAQRSLCLDLKLLAKTPLAMFSGF
jgi:lipopolysaccharide/colanic/teichoic acid biosynthesis glycosyltransferase